MKRLTYKAQIVKNLFNNFITEQCKSFQKLQKTFTQFIFLYHFN